MHILHQQSSNFAPLHQQKFHVFRQRLHSCNPSHGCAHRTRRYWRVPKTRPLAEFAVNMYIAFWFEESRNKCPNLPNYHQPQLHESTREMSPLPSDHPRNIASTTNFPQRVRRLSCRSKAMEIKLQLGNTRHRNHKLKTHHLNP